MVAVAVRQVACFVLTRSEPTGQMHSWRTEAEAEEAARGLRNRRHHRLA